MSFISMAADGQSRWFAPLFVFSILLSFPLSGCTATSYNQAKAKKQQLAFEAEAADEDELDAYVQAGPNGPATAPNILKTAFSQVGRPYKYAGTRPETGFDCSGFTSWVYGQYGVKLARSSSDQINNGKPVKQSELKPGDLVFFGRKKRITHVGIYTGDNKYIHSPTTGKRIQESNLDDRARGEYYVGARRVIDNKNAAPITDEQRKAWAPKAHQQLALAKPKGQSRPVASSGQTVVAAAKPVKHKVVAGDTFLALAKKYGVSSKDLAKANNLDSKQTALLKPGQVLIVPPKGQAQPAKAAPAPAVAPAQAIAAETQTPQAPAETKVAEAAAPVPPAAPAKTTHKVATGETFNALAIKYGVRASDLAKANNLNDKQIALLKPGQTLVIPPKTSSASGQPAQKPSPAVVKHKVTAGDTIYGLARKYGVSAQDLARANNLDSKQMAMLKLGQTLVVPSKSRAN